MIALLSGCGDFVHDEHLIGPYDLSAIDVGDQMSVYYELSNGGGIGRIDQTVFSVGWNTRYIVAKQHPDNNRSVTNFYYLDMTKDSPYADPKVSVTGPLTEAEFTRKKAELGLPPFSRTIDYLR
jgi:hypothetical protein